MIFPRPSVRYEERNETEFRSSLELYLRTLVAPPFNLTVISDSSASSTVTAVPAAKTEWQGSTRWRTRVNLRDYGTVELVTVVTTAGSVNAEQRFEYTADLTGATGWAYLDGTSGPKVTLASTGVKQNQVIITPAAKGTVLIRPVSINGDGATNASVGLTRLVFR